MWKNIDPFIGTMVGGIIVGIGFAIHAYFVPADIPKQEATRECVQLATQEGNREVWLCEKEAPK